MATLPARMNRSAQLMFLPYFCLIGHSRRRALSRLPLSGQLIERGEALLPAVGAAAPVGRAIGAGRVPGHADEEGAVMAVIGRPPRLAVGHQRGQVALQRLVVERLERLGIVEVVAHRVGRRAALVEDVERQRFGPPVAVWPAEQGAHGARIASTGQPIDSPVFASMSASPRSDCGSTLGRGDERRKRLSFVSESGKID